MEENRAIDSVATMLRDAIEGNETVFELERVLGEDGVSKSQITMGRRKLQPELPPEPRKAESPRRAHTFYSAAGFVAYLSQYKTKDTVVYVDMPNEKVHAVLNEVSKNGFETIELVPHLHPLWRPWQRIIGSTVKVADLADFLRTNRRVILEPEARELVLALVQVKTSISIEMQQGRGAESLNGLMIKTKLQGNEKSEIVELPEEIKINVPMYVSTEPVQLVIDLVLNGTRENGVIASLNSGDVLDAKTKCFEQIATKINDGLKASDVVIVDGVPDYSDWKYLPDNR